MRGEPARRAHTIRSLIGSSLRRTMSTSVDQSAVGVQYGSSVSNPRSSPRSHGESGADWIPVSDANWHRCVISRRRGCCQHTARTPATPNTTADAIPAAPRTRNTSAIDASADGVTAISHRDNASDPRSIHQPHHQPDTPYRDLTAARLFIGGAGPAIDHSPR